MYNSKSFSKSVKIVCLIFGILLTCGAILFFLPIGKTTDANADEIVSSFEGSGIHIPVASYLIPINVSPSSTQSWSTFNTVSSATASLVDFYFVINISPKVGGGFYLVPSVGINYSTVFTYLDVSYTPSCNYSWSLNPALGRLYSVAGSNVNTNKSYDTLINYFLTFRAGNSNDFAYVPVAFTITPDFDIFNVYSYDLETLETPFSPAGKFGIYDFKTCLTLNSTSDAATSGGWVKFYFPSAVDYYAEKRTYFLRSDVSYNEGYTSGYNDGVTAENDKAYKQGFNEGTIVGNQVGYNRGYSEGAANANNYSFMGLIGAVIDAPIKAFSGMLDFDVFGYNMKSFYLSLITLSVIIFIVKLLI